MSRLECWKDGLCGSVESEISKNKDTNNTGRQEAGTGPFGGRKGVTWEEESMPATKSRMSRLLTRVQDKRVLEWGERVWKLRRGSRKTFVPSQASGDGERHKPLSERVVEEVGSGGASGSSSQGEGGAWRSWRVYWSILSSVEPNLSSHTCSLRDLGPRTSSTHLSGVVPAISTHFTGQLGGTSG